MSRFFNIRFIIQKVLEINEGNTRLILKKLIPVRMIGNPLFNKLTSAQESGATRRELLMILGDDKSKMGIFEGNIENGELETGQVSMLIRKSETASGRSLTNFHRLNNS